MVLISLVAVPNKLHVVAVAKVVLVLLEHIVRTGSAPIDHVVVPRSFRVVVAVQGVLQHCVHLEPTATFTQERICLAVGRTSSLVHAATQAALVWQDKCANIMMDPINLVALPRPLAAAVMGKDAVAQAEPTVAHTQEHICLAVVRRLFNAAVAVKVAPAHPEPTVRTIQVNTFRVVVQ